MSTKRFLGKTVIVTGGAQGIGRGITRGFVREGAKVAFIDNDGEAGWENEQWIREQGGACFFLEGDAAKESDVIRLVDEAKKNYGGVDILINNAGIGSPGTLFTRPMEEWDRVIALNLTAPYMWAKTCAPEMIKAGAGCIINIASTRAYMSEANTEPYSASKGGLIALTHSLAVSLGPHIRVNAISPGWIETSDWQKKASYKVPVHSEQDQAQHPVGRVGHPMDIAEACLFLCSEQAGFITGTNLMVDGGMTIKMIYEE